MQELTDLIGSLEKEFEQTKKLSQEVLKKIPPLFKEAEAEQNMFDSKTQLSQLRIKYEKVLLDFNLFYK